MSNPILRGYHPDPSIIRVGRDYYLTASTCEYFPGLPIYHSRDLIHWRLLGNVLERDSQLALRRAIPSRGIYAPTLRHHDGRFYLIATNVSFRDTSDRPTGNFFVTTDDPAGPWSDPIWIAGQSGIDPDLFWDDDGTVYLTTTGGIPGQWTQRGIYQSTIDLQSGRLTSPPVWMSEGSGGRYPEAPHLFKIDGRYYLIMAEGGTEYGHMATIFRSDSPRGPWQPCPRNPILSHRDLNFDVTPIHGTGHVDLIQDHAGHWWAVFLAFRLAGGLYHHLGRETFLAPVTWVDGWPLVNEGRPIDLLVRGPLLPAAPLDPPPVRTTFDRPPGPEWNHLRNPNRAAYALDDPPGYLTLRAEPFGLEAQDSPTWIGRRQQHFDVAVTTRLDFTPLGGEEAGLSAYMNPTHHYVVGIRRSGGRREAFVRQVVGPALSVITAVVALPETGPVELRINAETEWYDFACREDRGDWQTLGRAPARYLSSEVAGGFTGVFFGLFAAGNGSAAAAPARVSWLDYAPHPE